MSSYEYKVVAAPNKGTRARGVRTAESRFAFSLEVLMNQMAAEGWEYQRAETLPSEERTGLSSSQTVYRNVLVFRRARASDMSAYDPRLIAAAGTDPILLPPMGAGPDEPAEDGAMDRGLADMLRRRAARLLGSAGGWTEARTAADTEADQAPEADEDDEDLDTVQMDGPPQESATDIEEDDLPAPAAGPSLAAEFARIEAEEAQAATAAPRPARGSRDDDPARAAAE